MDDITKVEVKAPEIDTIALIDYFDEHPIMLISVSLALLTLGIGKVLDKKYSK